MGRDNPRAGVAGRVGRGRRAPARLAAAQQDLVAREQASLVWLQYEGWNTDDQGDEGGFWTATVFNGSQGPIFDVGVSTINGGVDDYQTVRPEPLPPGAREHIEGDADGRPDWLELGFTDAHGTRWGTS